MESFELTPFDSLVSDNQLQMLKAAIPYVANSHQRVLSLYVKFLEFSNTFQLVHATESQTLGICSIEEPKRNSREMLNAISQYCGDGEREIIELLTNFISAFQMYNNYQETPRSSGESERRSQPSPMDVVKNLLSPEQQVMLDTYSTLMASVR